MFGKLGEAFSSAVDKAKGAFSFGKSPEVSKTALPQEVDARPAIHDSVARVMDNDDSALESWASGGGWKNEKTTVSETSTPGRLDNVMFQSPANPMDRMDLRAFRNQAVSMDETRPDRLSNVVLDLPKTDAQKFRVDVAKGNGGLFGERACPTAEQSMMEVSVDSPLSIFARDGEAGRFDETPGMDMFDEIAKADLKAAPVYAPRPMPMPELQAARAATPDRWAHHDLGAQERNRPQDSIWAFRFRTAMAAMALLATVGGVAHAKSAHSSNKPRSYSVADITPLTNEQAAALEAQKTQKKAEQGAHQFIEITQR